MPGVGLTGGGNVSECDRGKTHTNLHTHTHKPIHTIHTPQVLICYNSLSDSNDPQYTQTQTHTLCYSTLSDPQHTHTTHTTSADLLRDEQIAMTHNTHTHTLTKKRNLQIQLL